MISCPRSPIGSRLGVLMGSQVMVNRGNDIAGRSIDVASNQSWTHCNTSVRHPRMLGTLILYVH